MEKNAGYTIKEAITFENGSGLRSWGKPEGPESFCHMAVYRQ